MSPLNFLLSKCKTAESQFFRERLTSLSDDKIISILSSQDFDNEIQKLATEEADKRQIKTGKPTTKVDEQEEAGDLRELDRWNWGACLMSPLWTLSHGLKFWAILSFVPLLNLLVAFYLGMEGNRLAYSKSNVKSVKVFLGIQDEWRRISATLVGIVIILNFISHSLSVFW